MQILAIGGPYPTAPVNAPTSLSAIPTNVDVAISFTAPTNNGGTPITNYEYSFNGSSWTAFSPVDAASPVTVSGLTQNTAYTIYLRAVNIVGSGPASTGVSFTTAGIPTGTTTITSVSSVSRTTATVNFTTTAGGGAITGYDYYLSSWVDAGVSSSPKNLTGLTASTGYTVYMRPKNAYGVGTQSAGVAFTTLASTLTLQTLVVGGGGSGGSGTGSGGGGGGGGGGGMGQVQTSAQGAGSYTITVGGVSGQSVSYFSGSTVVGNGGGTGANAFGNVGGNGGGGGSGTTYNGGTGGKSGDGGAQGAAGGSGTSCSIWGVGATTFGGAGGGGSGTGGAGGAGGGGNGGANVNGNGAGGSQYGAGGGGGAYASGAGGAGVQGLVYVSYLTSAAAGMSVTGGSKSTSGSYTVHTYTGSSSFTITLV